MYYRAKKLKSIKASCEQELNEFRAEKEAAFQRAIKAKQAELDSTDNSGADSQKTAQAMSAIENDYTVNKDEVIKMLIGNVMNVNIEIPRVIKGNFEEK